MLEETKTPDYVRLMSCFLLQISLNPNAGFLPTPPRTVSASAKLETGTDTHVWE